MSGYKWVRCHAGCDFPPHAVVGGEDIDGATIYVGRVEHAGDLLPAKVMPCKNVAYVCYGGEEIAKEHYEVLVHAGFHWVHAHNGNVPQGAVVGGRTCDGEELYIGRVRDNGATTIGKVHPSHGCCYIPFDSKENKYYEYEVLVCHF